MNSVAIKFKNLSKSFIPLTQTWRLVVMCRSRVRKAAALTKRLSFVLQSPSAMFPSDGI
jgi:hypothetical protein